MAVELGPVSYFKATSDCPPTSFRAFSGSRRDGMFGTLHFPHERSWVGDFKVDIAVGWSGLKTVLKGVAIFPDRDDALRFIGEPEAVHDCITAMQLPDSPYLSVFHPALPLTPPAPEQ